MLETVEFFTKLLKAKQRWMNFSSIGALNAMNFSGYFRK
jgi:hypothetical protein